jgi:hypothetical protein
VVSCFNHIYMCIGMVVQTGLSKIDRTLSICF